MRKPSARRTRATKRRPATFGRALLGQYNVINALVLRETRTRFGNHQLGYIWALLEPMLMILTFLVMFVVADRKTAGAMDNFGFLATGIVPYLLFSKSTVQVSQAINGNKGLLFYPQVKPLDVAFARVALEFGTYIAVFIFLMAGNAFFRREVVVSDPLLIVTGFALASLLGAALGLVFMGLGQLSNVTERARGPLMRPFFWVSGLFFTVEAVPEQYRSLLLYNPVLHLVELVRAGLYPNYSDQYTNIPYVLLWVLGLGLVGLGLETVTRRRIQVT